MASRQNSKEYPVRILREELRQRAAGKLLYLQHCRSSLEQCIALGASRLRFRWGDGQVTYIRFRKTAPARVKVSGLLPGTA